MHTKKHNRILCSSRKFRNKFVTKKSKINQLKSVNFSWSLLFIGVLAILVIIGISPLEFVSKFLRAQDSKMETINLYARAVQTDSDEDIYNKGWWQTDNAKLNPSLAEDASSLDFDDSNSAIYNGGNYSLTFSAFRFLEENLEEIKNEELIINNDEILASNGEDVDKTAINTDDVFVESGFIENDNNEEDLATSTKKIIENEESSLPVDTVIIKNDNISASSSTEDIVDKQLGDLGDVDLEEDNVIVDELEEDAGIEILNEDLMQNEETVIIENEEDIVSQETSLIDDLSWSGFVDKIFGSTVATAEEFISSDIKNLEDLGEFKSAKLKISLALNSLDTNQNDSNENDNQAKTKEIIDKLDYDLLVASSTGDILETDEIVDKTGANNIDDEAFVEETEEDLQIEVI